MSILAKTDICVAIVDCLENAGVDKNLISTTSTEKNILEAMDSLQYLAFKSELESKINVRVTDEFLISKNFDSLKEFADKLECYVNG